MSAIFYIPGNRLKFRLMPDSDIQTPSPRFTNLRIQLKILLWDNFLLKSSWKLSLQRYVKCFVKSAQILSNYNTFQASQSHSYMALSPRSRKEPGYEANSCIKRTRLRSCYIMSIFYIHTTGSHALLILTEF